MLKICITFYSEFTSPPPEICPTIGIPEPCCEAMTELVFSQFDPANFQTLFLPGTGNKPLDPLAVRAIHRTLVEMSTESLAAHLTKTDLEFFGLSSDSSGDLDSLQSSSCPENVLASSKFMILSFFSESGRQYRQDALDRCLCLRTLVNIKIGHTQL